MKRFMRALWNRLPLYLRAKAYRLRIALGSNAQTFGNPSYSEDGLHTDHICDFLQDSTFVASYEFGNSSIGLETKTLDYNIRFRAYVATWAALQGAKKQGCFVELGVGKAVVSGTIAKYFHLKGIALPMFYLFDTFQGIPIAKLQESELGNARRLNILHYQNDYWEESKQKFQGFPEVHLVKGILPDSLSLEFVSFLHVDLNNAKSEIESAKVLWDKVVPGGIVLLDDYAFGEEYRAQKHAWDRFASTKRIEILTLPTGQGLILKDTK